MARLLTIGLMLGDVAGIGPGIASKVLASGKLRDVANLVVTGDARVLELGIRDAGAALPYSTYESIDQSGRGVPIRGRWNMRCAWRQHSPRRERLYPRPKWPRLFDNNPRRDSCLPGNP